MSTVLLTPTHIASDHTVVIQTHPHTTRIDPKYKKLFMPKHKRFIIGTAGNFRPDEIDSKMTYDVCEEILTSAIASLIKTGAKYNPVFGDSSITYFKDTFDQDSKHLLITKHHRFIVYYSPLSKCINAVPSADYNGLGTGGFIACGLAIGGMDIHDLWPALHFLDKMSSIAHTVIPLSVLKDF